jgi:hypothetical protein
MLCRVCGGILDSHGKMTMSVALSATSAASKDL